MLVDRCVGPSPTRPRNMDESRIMGKGEEVCTKEEGAAVYRGYRVKSAVPKRSSFESVSLFTRASGK